MIEEKIEIVLITFNRYKYLDKTLSQLLESPFVNCKITILDNCSTDKTPEICYKYKNLFPNIIINRHKNNIGGNPNILRAVETSNSLYTWILCDDDDYDFSDCDDLLESIESEKFDIIMTFSHDFKNSEGKTINELLKEEKLEDNNLDSYHDTTSKKLFEIIGQYYFLIFSFVPTSIFKTELYDSECLIKGYDNVHNLYPHFKFITKSIENDFSIYKTKKDIIIAGDELSDSYTLLFWLQAWVDSSLMIKDKEKREIVFSNYFNEHTFFQMMIYSIILSKVNNESDFRNLIISLIAGVLKVKGLFKGLILSFFIIIISLTPRFLCKIINNKIEKILND